MSTLFKRLRHTFLDQEYRQIYAEGWTDSKIATQIKVLREQRGWTQQQLAEAAGMKQSRIAALEDVNYSSWSIRTLRRLAQAFDLWLDVEFKEFGTLWPQLRDFSRESLARRSFMDDPVFKQGKAGQEQAMETIVNKRLQVSMITSQKQSSGSVLGGALASRDPQQSSLHQRLASTLQSSQPSGNTGLNVQRPFFEGVSAAQIIVHGEHYQTQARGKESSALAMIE